VYKSNPYGGEKTGQRLAKALFTCKTLYLNGGQVKVRDQAWSELWVNGDKIAIFKDGVLRITLAGKPTNIRIQRRLQALGIEVKISEQGVTVNGRKINPNTWITMKTEPKSEVNPVEYTPLLKIVKLQSDLERVAITSPDKAAEYCRQFFGEDISLWESMFILTLDQANQTTGWAKISQGGVAGTVCDPKIIAHYAVANLAQGVIICHNHPSGSLKPSDQDIRMTKKIKEGLALLDISLTDHLILTEDSYTSLMQEGFV
jgi:DNA repair protein RadC